ncbi:MAG: SCP2 sterol-binding domain-containing protein [Hyphomonadaceae bacterium]|jgi:putative sterol carrier protein
MTDIESIEADIARRLVGRKPIGKTIAFDLQDKGFLLIDGVSTPPSVSQVRGQADATITISADDLKGLLDGTINGQSLMMTGRAKMKGNPMVVMKLAELLS